MHGSSRSTSARDLPDISSATAVSGFMTYSLKPFAFEFKVLALNFLSSAICVGVR
jgi:hypothetical protein